MNEARRCGGQIVPNGHRERTAADRDVARDRRIVNDVQVNRTAHGLNQRGDRHRQIRTDIDCHVARGRHHRTAEQHRVRNGQRHLTTVGLDQPRNEEVIPNRGSQVARGRGQRTNHGHVAPNVERHVPSSGLNPSAARDAEIGPDGGN